MRRCFVCVLTVLAVVFATNARAEETPAADEGTPQERCDAAGDVVASANAEVVAVEKELAGVEQQLVELRKQKQELTAKRDQIKNTRIDKRVGVKQARRSMRKACEQVVRCKTTNEKVLTSKKKMDALVKELSKVKQATGEYKQATSELLGKFEAVGKQEAELKCRKLKVKGGEPSTINACYDAYENYGQLKKELAGKNKELRATDKRYKKLAGKNKRKQSDLKYLGNRVRQNCAADGPEIKVVEELESQQSQYDEVDAELAAISGDVQKCRKIRVKKPKAKRVKGTVKVAASGKVQVKGKVEAKGKAQTKPAEKSKTKVKAKSSFEINGEASAKAKGKIQFKTK